jgi:hypothetical protein
MKPCRTGKSLGVEVQTLITLCKSRAERMPTIQQPWERE